MSTFDEGACGVKKAAIDMGMELSAIARGFSLVGVNVCGLVTGNFSFNPGVGNSETLMWLWYTAITQFSAPLHMSSK